MATNTTQQLLTAPHHPSDHLILLVVVVDADDSNNDQDYKCNYKNTSNEIEVPHWLSCNVNRGGRVTHSSTEW